MSSDPTQRKSAREPKPSGALAPSRDRASPPDAGPGTLRELYDRWLRLKLEHAGWLAGWRRRAEVLGDKSRYMLGTMEAARRFVEGDAPLERVAGDVASDVEAASRALEGERRTEIARYRRDSAAAARALERMAKRYLEHYAVPLRFRIYPIQAKRQAGRALVQVDEIGPDDSVLLVYALTGKLPTRYGFFADDASADDAGVVARWYVDDGAPRKALTDVERADREVRRSGRLLPVRTMIPIPVPGHEYPRFRLVAHGRVAELEARREGEPYANRVRAEDLELVSGYMISLRVAGRVDFRVDWPVPER